ncbi:hypothetical protein GCM10009827_073190 [Dactylosporangium maewongense]|uniref:Diguanylate cyclase/phosphodiesterase n=1 Tax=Dactylosporangium maewongense TaxID=634393 RepID=A0ABN2BN58_9ACTN
MTGLAVIMLGLTGLSVTGVAQTRRSAAAVSKVCALAAAYGRIHDAVITEERSERLYRVEPGSVVRTSHTTAGASLQDALLDVERFGTDTDRRLATELGALHGQYLQAVTDVFDAVDDGDVARIDTGRAQSLFERINRIVQTATVERDAQAARALRHLERVETLAFIATVAGFAVGLVLMTVLLVASVGYQRRLMRHAASSEYLASHDSLTGLPNRALFARRAADALRDAQDRGAGTSVLMLDLDRFKEVNDTLGHHYGDELLRQVAARTSATVRSGDLVARLSGDEFAILLPQAAAHDAARLATRLQSELHRSFVLDDVTVDIEASIGVAAAPEHATTVEAALRCADIAMYSAKDTKTGVAVYDPAMQVEDGSRLLLLGDLRRALDSTDQLTLHYQPKIRLNDGQVSGAEALVRWQHPTRGAIPPAEFIPVAETTGLISRLTLYVLRAALGQVRTWLDDGLTLPVAVNVSPRCLLDAGLVGHVVALLREFDVPASLLRLEVTESAVMANPATATATLTELHELGVRLSIDDYGTGYSSMAYLKRLPVDELKVDRTFVLHMDADHDDAVLVRGAIELGHNLGMTVVAEGVEGIAHVAALQALGCDIAQGYHYARPMPAADLSRWISDQRPATVPVG